MPSLKRPESPLCTLFPLHSCFWLFVRSSNTTGSFYIHEISSTNSSYAQKACLKIYISVAENVEKNQNRQFKGFFAVDFLRSAFRHVRFCPFSLFFCQFYSLKLSLS